MCVCALHVLTYTRIRTGAADIVTGAGRSSVESADPDTSVDESSPAGRRNPRRPCSAGRSCRDRSHPAPQSRCSQTTFGQHRRGRTGGGGARYRQRTIHLCSRSIWRLHLCPHRSSIGSCFRSLWIGECFRGGLDIRKCLRRRDGGIGSRCSRRLWIRHCLWRQLWLWIGEQKFQQRWHRAGSSRACGYQHISRLSPCVWGSRSLWIREYLWRRIGLWISICK